MNIQRKIKILFLTNVPSPYRVDFFNCLSQYCNLTVIYEKEYSDERDKRWMQEANDSYQKIFLKGIKTGVDKAFSLDVCKYLTTKKFDRIVICGISSPTEILAIKWCRIKKIPYYIEGDGGFPKGGRGIKECLKRHLISGAKLCFSTGQIHDQYYLAYGASKEKIVRYPFTSLREDDLLQESIKREEKIQLREQLGVLEPKMLLAVGQFIYRKGFDLLIEAARHLNHDIGIYFVGGEADMYMALKKKHDLSHVHFIGFKTKDELKDYYKAADVFVLPTREDIWGLVINEAMAYALPVITTDKCAAGMELVKNNVNGKIIRSDSVKELRIAINEIFDDMENIELMGIQSLDIIKKYTIENMAKTHMEIFCRGNVK